jgi:hypothetical protein
MRNGRGLRAEPGAARYRRIGGGRDCQETFRQLVRVGAGDAETEGGIARANGSSDPDDRMVVGGNLGPLDSRVYDGLHGGAQQRVLGHESQG